MEILAGSKNGNATGCWNRGGINGNGNGNSNRCGKNGISAETGMNEA